MTEQEKPSTTTTEPTTGTANRFFLEVSLFAKDKDGSLLPASKRAWQFENLSGKQLVHFAALLEQITGEPFDLS